MDDLLEPAAELLATLYKAKLRQSKSRELSDQKHIDSVKKIPPGTQPSAEFPDY